MNETEVVLRLAEYLGDRDYTFFVDSGYDSDKIHALPDKYPNCGMNTTITIGRRIPDIIGFTPREEIFAIEAKGDESLRKGIGQAAHYRQGVHKSYLAADVDPLAEFKDTALSCGLGVLPVGNSGVLEAQVTEPVENVGATKLNRTRRALSVRTSRFEPASTAFPSTTRPANALLPVIAIKEEGTGAIPEAKCEQNIEDSPQSLNRTLHAMALAKTLRLIESVGNGDVRVTDEGNMGYLLLHGIVETLPKGSLGITNGDGEDIHHRMYKAIDRFKNAGPKLYEVKPELAAFLRNQYLDVPDIRLLAHILSTHDSTRIELSRVLAEVALESPDAFLNLFCGLNQESKFRELVEGTQLPVENEEFREDLLEIASANALYNFVYQIWHVGLLGEGTDAVHQSDDLALDEFYWEWDSGVIGGFEDTF